MYGHAGVMAWLEHEKDNCYTSAIVIAQLAYWVRSKRGKQREALQAWLTRLIEALHGRILGFNASVAHVSAKQQHELEEIGQPMPVEDSYIAAIAIRHNLTVAIGNEKDFRRSGVKLFNPLEETAPAAKRASQGTCRRRARRKGGRYRKSVAACDGLLVEAQGR